MRKEFLHGIVLAFCFAAPAHAATIIELTPTDVGSTSNSVFSTVPTLNPALFGFDPLTTVGLNFDDIATGVSVTNQYASDGVLISGGVTTSASVYQGPASQPNALYTSGGTQLFTFTSPVTKVGIINTSPDYDTVSIFSTSGALLMSFQDQEGLPKNFNVDRFVGFTAGPGELIGSFSLTNQAGNLELDELLFTPAAQVPLPATFLSLLTGLGLFGLLGRRRRDLAGA